MRRGFALLVLSGAGASLGLGCDQIFGLSEVNTIYPHDATVDGTSSGGGDAGADALDGGDSTTGGDTASGGDTGSAGDAPIDTAPSCDAAGIWAQMFASPIVPPYQIGGLDLRGADDAGITFAEIQAAACEVFDGGEVPPGEWSAYWGGDGSAGAAVILVNYDPSSGRYAYMQMSAGYTGALDFHGADSGAYHMSLTGDITKNDASFPLDWADLNTDASVLEGQVTELRNAMIATYAPGTPPSSNCRVDRTCAIASGSAGDVYLGVRAPLFFYAYFADPINHPSQPASFYTFTNFLQWNDPLQPSNWQTFDTTQLGANVKSFAGLAISPNIAVYPAPSGAAPLSSFNLSSDAFTSADGGAWSTYDAATLSPQPQGFTGAATDGQFVYYAGTSGVCAQYDNTASFTFPGAWTTFDTKTLPTPAKAFAGVAFVVGGGAALFVPSQDGVVAFYAINTTASDFGVAANWTTYDLTQVNAGLKQFYGAVRTGQGVSPIYLVPKGGTVFGEYLGWPAPINAAASWNAFDVSVKGTNIAPGYATGVYDQVQYVYFSPAVAGYPPLRYDTKQPFTSASAWDLGRGTININVRATGFDGRYVYFVGTTTTVFRYDTTQSFTTSSAAAWTQFDMKMFDTNAVAFGATGNDGRYQYFIPSSSGDVMRFDSRFGAPLPHPEWSSF